MFEHVARGAAGDGLLRLRDTLHQAGGAARDINRRARVERDDGGGAGVAVFQRRQQHLDRLVLALHHHVARRHLRQAEQARLEFVFRHMAVFQLRDEGGRRQADLVQAFLGMDDELVESDWPWKCTLCGKCEVVCPMNVEILQLIRRIRARRDRDKVPAAIQKGVVTCLEKGNNLGIPKDDFLLLIRELGEELAQGSCPGFVTPVDVRGARMLVTVNSKQPFAEPDSQP